MVKVIDRVEREMILAQHQALQKKLNQVGLSERERKSTAHQIECLVNLHKDDVKFC